jgi:serine protease Do
MKIRSHFYILLTIFNQFIFSFASEEQTKPISISKAVQQIYPAIVRIEVVSEQGSGGRMMKSRATGSGVIVSKDGRVITNHHVAGKATRISCRLYDGEEIMADLLGADPLTDLAVLKLRIKNRAKGSKILTVAEFADSDQVRVGDACFAMGSPAGLSQSVTKGIISNIALISANRGSLRLDGENVGELVRWLGHDAVIFPGNSGGPLINKDGKIIGINEVGIGSLGGAIPSNLAQSVSDELADKGFISRCWTGLECQPMLNSEYEGILVSGVIEKSPAENAGFRPGDIISFYGGERVSARIQEDLPIFNQLAYSMRPGKEIKVSGLRKNNQMSWNLTPIKRESAFAKEKELKSWGLTVRDLTLMSSLEARRPSKKGAQVHTVSQGGPSSSSKPSLRPGDIITSINNEFVTCIQDMVRITKKVTSGKKEPVSTLVSFERNLAKLLTVVKIGPAADENRPVQAWKAWLGVSTQVLTRELSKALSLPSTTRGVRIVQVFPETPAENAKLQAGDLLFRIDSQIIQAYRTEDAEVFGNMIKEYKPGANVVFTGLRNGKVLNKNIKLERRPTPANELPDFEEKTFEFTVRELSFGDRVNQRLKNNEPGLIVENVESAGWASIAGLRQGDLIIKINDQLIKNIERFQEEMDFLIKERENKIIFFVKRGIHTHFLELEPDWKNSI